MEEEVADHGGFKCDLCQSTQITRATRRRRVEDREAGRRSRPVYPRKRFDPEKLKWLTLCNACGLGFGKPQRSIPPTMVEGVDQSSYIEAGRKFSMHIKALVNVCSELDLYCTVYGATGCGCLQKYLGTPGLSEGSMDALLSKVVFLVTLYEDAKRLKSLKCFRSGQVQENQPSGSARCTSGIRKSKLYEDFVLTNRQVLKKDCHLCTRTIRKILLYSNNFLYRRLKNSDSTSCQRVLPDRNYGKSLAPVSELSSMTCCDRNCCQMAKTHPRLLQKWRTTALSGQKGSQRVVAEMLTPSGGGVNCFAFIGMVTGRKPRTILKVADRVRATGGEQEPPEHGLKKYWRKVGHGSRGGQKKEPAAHPRSKLLVPEHSDKPQSAVQGIPELVCATNAPIHGNSVVVVQAPALNNSASIDPPHAVLTLSQPTTQAFITYPHGSVSLPLVRNCSQVAFPTANPAVTTIGPHILVQGGGLAGALAPRGLVVQQPVSVAPLPQQIVVSSVPVVSPPQQVIVTNSVVTSTVQGLASQFLVKPTTVSLTSLPSLAGSLVSPGVLTTLGTQFATAAAQSVVSLPQQTASHFVMYSSPSSGTASLSAGGSNVLTLHSVVPQMCADVTAAVMQQPSSRILTAVGTPVFQNASVHTDCRSSLSQSSDYAALLGSIVRQEQQQCKSTPGDPLLFMDAVITPCSPSTAAASCSGQGKQLAGPSDPIGNSSCNHGNNSEDCHDLFYEDGGSSQSASSSPLNLLRPNVDSLGYDALSDYFCSSPC